MRSSLPLLLAWWALTSCDRTQTLALPPTPDQDLAFAILYDGDAVVEIGAVTRRQTLYAGRYTVQAGDRGLSARLFFLLLSDLVEASRSACDTLSAAVDRAACDALVSTCEEAPERCLLVAKDSEGCGERIPLGADLPLLGFRSESDVSEPLPGDRAEALLRGAVACGPAASPPCPNRLPGFVITEEGSVQCVAPTEQIECALTVDLSRCGLGELAGELTEDGTFSGDGSSCAVEGSTTEGTVGGAEGYVLRCGERRFVASAMGLAFGERGCRRRGSPAYNTVFSAPGVITGLAAFEPAGWARRHVMTGFGADDCAATGCSHRGSSCDRCNDSCDIQFDLPECQRSDWPACVGIDAREDCLRRCRKWCMRPDQGCGDSGGLVLTTHAPDRPEQEQLRVDLDALGGGGRAVSSAHALALLEPDQLVVATDRQVILLQAGEPDVVEALEMEPVPFSVGGVVRRPDNEIAVFGADGVPSVGKVARLRVTGSPATLELVDEVTVDVAGGFDVAVATDRWLYAGTAQPPAGAPARAVVTALPHDGGTPATSDLGEGRLTALLPLEDGAVLAGIATRTGGRLALLRPGTAAVEQTTEIPLPDGLRPSALAKDPERPDRVFVGLERTSASEPALVGLFLAAPEPRFLPAMIETTEAELSVLYLDPALGTLLAVARHRNVITPIHLID